MKRLLSDNIWLLCKSFYGYWLNIPLVLSNNAFNKVLLAKSYIRFSQ